MTPAEKADIMALQCLVSALVEVVSRDADAREDFEAAVVRHLEPYVSSGEFGPDVTSSAAALLRPKKRTRPEDAQATAAVHHAEDLWQAIETAPKDGTLFDVWTARGQRFTMVCSVVDERWPNGAIVYHDNRIGATVAITDATHWRPLPFPPDRIVTTPRA